MAESSSSKNLAPPLSTPRKRQKRAKDNMKGKGKGKDNNHHNVEDWVDVKPWNWESLTDSHSTTAPPVFTKDGSYFFSLNQSSVKILSVATGELVSTLTAPQTPSDTLTCLALNPHNAFQLIVGTFDGRLLVWDFMDAVLLRTIHLGQPIHRLATHVTLQDSVFVAVSKSRKNKPNEDSFSVLRVSIQPSADSSEKPSEIVAVGKTKAPTGLALSGNGAWLVVSAGHKVYVAATSSINDGFVKYVSPERLTCLAFHPNEEYFATGDAKGVVRLWYCLNDQVASQMKAVGVEKKTQTSAFHWHAHAVSSLAFSADGAHLFSGGEEAVLVVWQLQTGRKEFVPRVGAPITTISTVYAEDGEEILLTLADATNLFIKSVTLKVSRSFSRVKLEHSTAYGHTESSLECPLAYHCLTSTLVLSSSHPSSLQIFSIPANKIVGELEVSPSNRISRRDEKPLESARVEQVVISGDGLWMATIDTRRGDASFRPEAYLKVWSWDTMRASWVLNTRIDRPHGLKKVWTVAFSAPSATLPLQMVTTGEDGKVRTWRIQTSKDKNGQSEAFWISRATLSLRNEPPLHAAWSTDGTILAITYTSSVALYDSQTCNMKASLSSPDCELPLSSHFVGLRYLVLQGQKWVALWDILSRSVLWYHRTKQAIDRMVCHVHAETFAVFHCASRIDGGSLTRISLFNVTSSSPSTVHSLPFGIRNVAWSAPPSLSDDFSLVAVTKHWGIAAIGDQFNVSIQSGGNARSIVGRSVPQGRSLFRDIFGQSRPDDLPASSQNVFSDVAVKAAANVVDLFDGPAYLMPPVESLFESLVGSALREVDLSNQTSQGTEPQESDDEDVVMEDTPVATTQAASTVSVSDSDFQNLVDLFSKQTIKRTPHLPQTNGNGKPKTNGHASSPNPKANGKHPLSTTKVSSSLKALPPALQTQLLSPSPSPEPVQTTTGKKRKKAT